MKLIQDIGRPLFTPESHGDLRRAPAAILAAVRPEILAEADEFLAEPTAESFLRFEGKVLRILQHAACHMVAAAVILLHEDASWTTAAVATERDAAPVRHGLA